MCHRYWLVTLPTQIALMLQGAYDPMNPDELASLVDIVLMVHFPAVGWFCSPVAHHSSPFLPTFFTVPPSSLNLHHPSLLFLSPLFLSPSFLYLHCSSLPPFSITTTSLLFLSPPTLPQNACKVLEHADQRKEIREHVMASSLDKLKLDDENTIG